MAGREASGTLAVLVACSRKAHALSRGNLHYEEHRGSVASSNGAQQQVYQTLLYPIRADCIVAGSRVRSGLTMASLDEGRLRD
jgi:hypothetical protein